MTAHDWYVENLAAYATRVLDREDARLFTSHLRRCPDCRAAVATLHTELAWLPLGARPVPPRPGATRRLTERVLARRRSWRRWMAPFAAVALFAMVGGLWLATRQRIARLETAVVARDQRARALQDSLYSIVGAERVMQQTIRGGGYAGGLLLFYDEDTHLWNVGIHGLPTAEAGKVYQVWFLTPRGVLPGPELYPAGGRPVFVTFRLRPNTDDPIGAKLTLEPVSGPDDRPVGLELATVRF